jgi:hypothetical protein
LAPNSFSCVILQIFANHKNRVYYVNTDTIEELSLEQRSITYFEALGYETEIY